MIIELIKFFIKGYKIIDFRNFNEQKYKNNFNFNEFQSITKNIFETRIKNGSLKIFKMPV